MEKCPHPRQGQQFMRVLHNFFWKCCFGSFSLFKVFTCKKAIPSRRVWKDAFVFLSLFGARIE